MNKEEILEKSRKEGRDEGREFTDSQGRRYGVSGMCVMFIVLAVFNLYRGQSNYQILALFFAYLGMEAFGMYRVNGEKIRIVTAIGGLIAAILFGVCHVMNVLM